MNNKTRAIWQGVGSLLNISGSSFLQIQVGQASDISSVKNDWNNIVKF